MRKLILTLAAAASGLAFASPASAQYYRPYDYGYGFSQHQEIVSGLQRRIYNVLGTINSAPYDQQYRLRAEAISLDRQVRYAARNGLNPPNEVWVRLERLEIAAQRAAQYGRYGYGRYQNYDGYYGDRRPHRGDWDRDEDDD